MMLSHSLLSALFLGLALAHGDPAKELSARSQFLAVHTNNLNHCVKRHQQSGLDERAIQRRARTVRDLTGRDMFHGRPVPKTQAFPFPSSCSHQLPPVKRQTSSVDKSHKSTQPYNITTDPAIVFGGKPNCVLSPETTEGPFCKIAA